MSITYPISQGNVMDPELAPTINNPVKVPVNGVCCPAKEMVVGKIAAIKAPVPAVPIISAKKEVGNAAIKTKHSKLPDKLPNNNTAGLSFPASGIEINLATVKVPQNTEVK